jgi:hypothetical protein
MLKILKHISSTSQNIVKENIESLRILIFLKLIFKNKLITPKKCVEMAKVHGYCPLVIEDNNKLQKSFKVRCSMKHGGCTVST